MTRNECKAVIEGLIDIFKKSGLENEVSFLIYGSYFSNWRPGLSDLDGIIYFQHHWPTWAPERIKLFQDGVKRLHLLFPFTLGAGFFDDVYVVDGVHGADGRFFIFDKGFMVFNPDQHHFFGTETNHQIVFGRDFIQDIRPNLMELRYLSEWEIAWDLQFLRNFMLFEIPRLPSLDAVTKVMKPFKKFPRLLKILLNEPMIKKPCPLNELRPWLSDIDFSPLEELWRQTAEIDSLVQYLSRWLDSEDPCFMACLECYEKTLSRVIKHVPMRSSRSALLP